MQDVLIAIASASLLAAVTLTYALLTRVPPLHAAPRHGRHRRLAL
jgi:hypothetical protein